ncbi:hypothetical protein PHMEG_0008560 [Phytophthora megakarya]|uniref:Uncharacterized protein n=1 Tax=Phytophthora megakarya TaxID=4795 RepID=A0A225WIG3_9STRA|nr:hypothetical protein PHMEG_0008560 [Phytophthora megakarya]
MLDVQEAQKKLYDRRRTANPFTTHDLNISHATSFTEVYPALYRSVSHPGAHGNVALLDLPAKLKHISSRFNIGNLKVYSSSPDRFVGLCDPEVD